MNPHLTGKELAAHYPSLFNLAEKLIKSGRVRKYPLTLALISFTQEFEFWVLDCVKNFCQVLDLRSPVIHRLKLYGEDPNIQNYLEFLIDYLDSFADHQPELAACFIFDLEIWHRSILMRTADQLTYLATSKCPMCSRFSVMKIDRIGLCFHNDCQQLWDRKTQKAL